MSPDPHFFQVMWELAKLKYREANPPSAVQLAREAKARAFIQYQATQQYVRRKRK